jgi:D-glycero-D-manno-heptose 1,7-bisphosphate phosphatase
MSGRPVVFLDRDGTLIEDPGYLDDPAGVRLIPGVPDALCLLEDAGYARIVITNQSGIGRGRFDEAAFHRVETEVARQLAQHGASTDRTYWCPHLPEAGCACRKPGTAHHRAAAATYALDLGRSWCIGDRLGDVEAAVALGGRAILVETGEGHHHADVARARGIPVAPDLLAAVRFLLAADPASQR